MKRFLRYRGKWPRYVLLLSFPLFPTHLVSQTNLSANPSKGNTLGAATNTVGKGVQGITDTTGNVVSAGGKGLGDAVTGVTKGVGDTTKGAFCLALSS